MFGAVVRGSGDPQRATRGPPDRFGRTRHGASRPTGHGEPGLCGCQVELGDRHRFPEVGQLDQRVSGVRHGGFPQQTNRGAAPGVDEVPPAVGVQRYEPVGPAPSRVEHHRQVPDVGTREPGHRPLLGPVGHLVHPDVHMIRVGVAPEKGDDPCGRIRRVGLHERPPQSGRAPEPVDRQLTPGQAAGRVGERRAVGAAEVRGARHIGRGARDAGRGGPVLPRGRHGRSGL